MEPLNTHVGSVKVKLQQAPVVFEPVRVNIPIHVGYRVIYDLMFEFGESVIRPRRIGIDSRPSLNVLAHSGLNLRFLPALHSHGPNFPAALQDSNNSSLVHHASSGNLACPNMLVHVASLATDEGLIGFNDATLAAELNEGVGLESKTNAMHHEPRRFLSDSEGASDLAGANTILAVAKHPESGHPLVQTQGRILEYGTNLERELFLAPGAEPDAARLDEGVLLRFTAGAANRAIRPTKVQCVLKAAVWIAEVNDRLLKRFRRVHVPNLRRMALCVKYIIPQSCHLDRSGPGFPASLYPTTATYATLRKERRTKHADYAALYRKSGERSGEICGLLQEPLPMFLSDQQLGLAVMFKNAVPAAY
jgi:hypothetical protein